MLAPWTHSEGVQTEAREALRFGLVVACAGREEEAGAGAALAR